MKTESIDFKKKKLIIFDLDGTLAPSKSAMGDDVVAVFMKLLGKMKVAIMSGCGFPQFETQVINKMPTNSAQFSNLYLLPTSGTKLYSWRGQWCEQYAEHLSPREKQKVLNALQSSLTAAGHQAPAKLYGPTIEDRGSQITFSALGQTAPFEPKQTWDPKREKRQKIISFLAPQLPEFDVRIGGTTSIDITKKGVNKAYGIRKLETFLNVSTEDIVYVGDSLFHGGNDYPARATGVDCVSVTGPEDTKYFIERVLSSVG